MQYPSPEVARLFEQAKNNTGPRKHHLVPAFYLRQWASHGKLRVHHVNQSRSHFSSPEKAARQTGYYSAASDDLDPDEVPPMLFETLLSVVESQAVAPLDRLRKQPPRITAADKYLVAQFMAMQYARGHSARLRIRAIGNEFMKRQLADLSDDGVAVVLQRAGVEPTPDAIADGRQSIQELQEGTICVRPQDVQAISMAFSAAEAGTEMLFGRPWVVASSPAVLVTTDEPVLPIGGPGHRRIEAAGVGTAGIVAFPLSPDRVLLALRRDLAARLGLPNELSCVSAGELKHSDARGLNRELLAVATRWAFERPTLDHVAKLVIPHQPDDLSVEEFESTSDDSLLIRHFNFTRWRYVDDVPDWPLRQLWPPGWRAWPLPADVATELEAQTEGAAGPRRTRRDSARTNGTAARRRGRKQRRKK